MKTEECISKHPFEPFIPENATKLIIGTIPPFRFCKKENQCPNLKVDDVNFYYGSQDNGFWELISSVTNEKFENKNSNEAIQQRKDFLTKNNIGITDIIESCYHLNKRSDDASLKVIKQKDIRSLLSEHKSIDTLIYTSNFVKTLMNSIGDRSYHTSIDEKNREWSILINDKKYTVIILYSPSPNAIRGVKKEIREKQYQNVFGEGNKQYLEHLRAKID